MTNKNSEFPTRDFNEASFLCCKSAKLIRLDYLPKDKAFIFIFKDLSLCEKLLQEYYDKNKKSLVYAKDIDDARLALRQRMRFEQERNEK